MQQAEQRSQALEASSLMAAAAQARAVGAGQRPDPMLRLGLDNVPVEGGGSRRFTREPTTARSIALSQTLTGAAKRAARSERYTQEAHLALSRRAAQRSELRRSVALVWWRVRAEEQRLALLAAQKDEAGLTVAAAEAAYRAGRGAQVDVFMARSAVVALQDLQLATQARLDGARTELRRWVGAAADRPLAAAPALTLPPLGDRAAAWEANDPLLLAAGAREATSSAQAAQAREERSADWSVDVRYAQLGSSFDNKLSVGFSVPLQWNAAKRQDREWVARLAEADQAQAEAEEIRRARRADVERWEQGWSAGLQRLTWLDRERLPLVQARGQAALGAYRAGSGPLQAVLDARQAGLALQLERVQLELDTASDWARLNTLNNPEEVTP
ncbi:TolC family protein [Hydrogenophaga sp. PAMC20947]|nr:TolC family protein [Hydrogenophaga sp. PAMC20947]